MSGSHTGQPPQRDGRYPLEDTLYELSAVTPHPAGQRGDGHVLSAATMRVMAVLDRNGLHVRWPCVYCGTFQGADRLDCCNCGAPRAGVREAFDYVVRRLGEAQNLWGLNRRL